MDHPLTPLPVHPVAGALDQGPPAWLDRVAMLLVGAFLGVALTAVVSAHAWRKVVAGYRDQARAAILEREALDRRLQDCETWSPMRDRRPPRPAR